jgi:small subunit ribosomal protein S18
MPAVRGNRRSRQIKIIHKDPKGNPWVDYKDVDDLRRLMTPNGKIYSRKRLGTGAAEQHRVSQAIKRARFMGLLPYTSGTL